MSRDSSSTRSRHAEAGSSAAAAAHQPRERITLHGLECEVLERSERGDGRHLVLKTALGGTPAVLKLYGRKRDWVRDTLRDFGHRWLMGKTGMTPRSRWQTERETLALWRRHGFDVPAELDLPLPAAMPPLHLLTEFVPGEPLKLALRQRTLPLPEKERLVERLAADCGRRHALAIELREPRLVQAHASLSHVLHVAPGAVGPGSPERLVSLDFEVVWARRSAVPRLVSLEITQLFESIASCEPLEQIAPLIAAFVRGYPERARLARTVEDVRHGRLPLFSWINRIGLHLQERGPRRKLALLRHLRAALAEGPAQDASRATDENYPPAALGRTPL